VNRRPFAPLKRGIGMTPLARHEPDADWPLASPKTEGHSPKALGVFALLVRPTLPRLRRTGVDQRDDIFHRSERVADASGPKNQRSFGLGSCRSLTPVSFSPKMANIENLATLALL
jgi:hypothetical protein